MRGKQSAAKRWWSKRRVDNFHVWFLLVTSGITRCLSFLAPWDPLSTAVWVDSITRFFHFIYLILAVAWFLKSSQVDCPARCIFFVPPLRCTCDGLLSWSLSSWYHTSSAAVKVKCLLTWPPCIIDCGVTWCARVRMHVTLWLHTAGSVGVVWKHLQFQDPVGAWLYRAGFISGSFWKGRVELFGV